MNLFALVLVDILIGRANDGDVVTVLKHFRIVSTFDLDDLTENELRPALVEYVRSFRNSSSRPLYPLSTHISMVFCLSSGL